MSQVKALTFLEEKLVAEIKSFNDSRQFYRRNFYIVTLLTAVISAMTTVLIGVGQMYDSQRLAVLALVASACITVIAAWDSFYRSRDLWIQKTDTWMALENLDSNIKYAKAKLGDDLTQEQVDEFYLRFNETGMGEHELWKKVRSTQSATTAKQP